MDDCLVCLCKNMSSLLSLLQRNPVRKFLFGRYFNRTFPTSLVSNQGVVILFECTDIHKHMNCRWGSNPSKICTREQRRVLMVFEIIVILSFIFYRDSTSCTLELRIIRCQTRRTFEIDYILRRRIRFSLHCLKLRVVAKELRLPSNHQI